MFFEGQDCRVSASIGIALSRQVGDPDADGMTTMADAALYAAKRAGRGRAVIATKD
jgi:predicted signal transduction protein with EAL and GGDEF domain